MPPKKSFPFCQKTIGTALRKPVRVIKNFQRDVDAFRNIDGSVWIVGAAAVLLIQVAAADVGKADLPCLDIFKTVQTAFGAAVAKRLPLLSSQS